MVPDFARYLLNAIRGEMQSLMVESVYQQRSQRLGDMGFCDPFEAKAIYALLDPERYRQEVHEKVPLGLVDVSLAPAFMLTSVTPTGFLEALLLQGLSEELAWELACLINKAPMAIHILILIVISALGGLPALRHLKRGITQPEAPEEAQLSERKK